MKQHSFRTRRSLLQIFFASHEPACACGVFCCGFAIRFPTRATFSSVIKHRWQTPPSRSRRSLAGSFNEKPNRTACCASWTRSTADARNHLDIPHFAVESADCRAAHDAGVLALHRSSGQAFRISKNWHPRHRYEPSNRFQSKLFFNRHKCFRQSSETRPPTRSGVTSHHLSSCRMGLNISSILIGNLSWGNAACDRPTMAAIELGRRRIRLNDEDEVFYSRERLFQPPLARADAGLPHIPGFREAPIDHRAILRSSEPLR